MPTLSEVYYNPKTSTRNAKLLGERANTTTALAKAFLAGQTSNAVQTKWTAPPVGSPQYSPTGAPAFHYQADVIWFELMKSKNKQKKAILTVINTTSRYAYARALKDAKAATVVIQMKDILDEMQVSKGNGKRKITHLRVDGGGEFKGETRTLLNNRNIEVDQAEPFTHFRIRRTDAFHRTLRNRIGEHFERENTSNWTGPLADIVDNINNTPHTAMSEILQRSATPKSITMKDEDKIRAHEMRLATASHLEIDRMHPVVIGRTRVRLLVAKTKNGGPDKFAKTHRANWSEKTYKVLARNGPNSFLIDVPLTGKDREIKIWPAHSLQFLSEADSEKINSTEPVPIMGTGGQMTERVRAQPGNEQKKSTRVNLKAASAKRLEAVSISESEQKKATLQHKRRPTITTRSKAVKK
jgi:hypothetical protein